MVMESVVVVDVVEDGLVAEAVVEAEVAADIVDRVSKAACLGVAEAC